MYSFSSRVASPFFSFVASFLFFLGNKMETGFDRFCWRSRYSKSARIQIKRFGTSETYVSAEKRQERKKSTCTKSKETEKKKKCRRCFSLFARDLFRSLAFNYFRFIVRFCTRSAPLKFSSWKYSRPFWFLKTLAGQKQRMKGKKNRKLCTKHMNECGNFSILFSCSVFFHLLCLHDVFLFTQLWR